MTPTHDCSAGSLNPSKVVHEGREGQRQLCRDLEMLADQLGDGIDQPLTDACCRYLEFDLAVHQKDEEAVYDVLKKLDDYRAVDRLVELAVMEHTRHREYALELLEWLAAPGNERIARNREAFGFLLRCTFENIEQHMAWEEAALLEKAWQSGALWTHPALAARLAENRCAQWATLRLISPTSER